MSKEFMGVHDSVSKRTGKGLGGAFQLSGNVHYLLRDKDGQVKDERDIQNLVTNAGFAAVASLLLSDVGSAGEAFDYIAIGIGTGQTASSTTLSSEVTTNGGERAASTGTRITTTETNDTAQLVLTYNFTGSFAVTESGVFNDTAAGDMLCVQSFSAINVANGDSLQVTWKIQVS